MPSTNGHGAKPERVALYLRVSSEEQRTEKPSKYSVSFWNPTANFTGSRWPGPMLTMTSQAPFHYTSGPRVGSFWKTRKRASSRPYSSIGSTGSGARCSWW